MEAVSAIQISAPRVSKSWSLSGSFDSLSLLEKACADVALKVASQTQKSERKSHIVDRKSHSIDSKLKHIDSKNLPVVQISNAKTKQHKRSKDSNKKSTDPLQVCSKSGVMYTSFEPHHVIMPTIVEERSPASKRKFPDEEEVAKTKVNFEKTNENLRPAVESPLLSSPPWAHSGEESEGEHRASSPDIQKDDGFFEDRRSFEDKPPYERECAPTNQRCAPANHIPIPRKRHKNKTQPERKSGPFTCSNPGNSDDGVSSIPTSSFTEVESITVPQNTSVHSVSPSGNTFDPSEVMADLKRLSKNAEELKALADSCLQKMSHLNSTQTNECTDPTDNSTFLTNRSAHINIQPLRRRTSRCLGL